ncbi:MAG: D-alanyl-D-alanine carboxypeptidase family protein [Actinobacteria bacterium]|nr:D-alanyl-D-alanine carboxypeptidase family protein [Actinomycetota bacterium]
MSVIIAGIVCTAAVLTALFLGELGSAASARARAQVAADAAALAAVAEGAPYGNSDPAGVAGTYAEANGAVLVSCGCDPLSDQAKVVVKVDGVEATARAELDAELFGALALPGDARGLHPEMKEAVDGLLRAAAGAVTLREGYRSVAEQRIRWLEALEKYGDPEVADDWVARPGHSLHQSGLAVDLGGDVELAARLVGELGLPLWRPMSWEPWHFELVGSRG